MSPEARSAEDLAAVTAENRLTSDPFPRRMVARDQANQGAAVLLTSVGKARALGVPEDRWVYLLGGADARERTPMERADLSKGPASELAVRQALDAAGASFGRPRRLRSLQLLPDRGVQHLRRAGPRARRSARPDGDRRAAVLRRRRQQLLDARHRQHGPQAARGCRARWAWSAPTAASCRNTPWASIRRGRPSGAASTPRRCSARSTAGPRRSWRPTTPARPTIETYTIDYAGKEPRGVVIGRTPSDARFAAAVEDRRHRPPADRRGVRWAAR